MKLFNKRMRKNGQTNLIHTRADIDKLIEFCNMLADKVNELIESNNRLAESSEKMSSAIEELKGKNDGT